MTTHTPHHATSRRFSFAFALATLLTITLAAIPARCQSPPQTTPSAQPASAPAQQPEFEVASVRMVDPHSATDILRGIGQFSVSTYPTTRFFMHNTSLDILIASAYGIDALYIQNDPDWTHSQGYDIDATVEGERPLTHEEIEPLLQNLLQQRFHLSVHHEMKTASGFVLVVAKGGPKLQPAKEGAQPHDYPFHAALLPNRLDAWGISIDTLAQLLAHPAGQPVVDKTGLTGTYDIVLKFATANDPDSNLPDIFTALQEQLGLKLVPQKVPVDLLVIDHVDKIPTDN
jgi:uncharacterized protein (TIGR03435 family)